MENRKTSESRLKAQKKYDQKIKDTYKAYNIKLNIFKDSDILDKLGTVESVQSYIKELIRKDINEDL